MNIQQIITDCDLGSVQVSAVAGGDINTCYCLQQQNQQWFLKMNDAAGFPVMFEKEANGLHALACYSEFVVPSVLQCGKSGNQQYLLMEWIHSSAIQAGSWEYFGYTLAAMHQQPQAYFGWECDNYIGSLQQLNTSCKSWDEFYAQYRILPLVKRLFDAGTFQQRDINEAEKFCSGLSHYFPAEPPAFLHGDLWSGNFMSTADGKIALIDPAVYYGHREMDIGMMKLFGGFHESLFYFYNEIYPLEKGWEQRLTLTQLYPMLVHAVLFGGNYINRAKEMVRQFI